MFNLVYLVTCTYKYVPLSRSHTRTIFPYYRHLFVLASTSTKLVLREMHTITQTTAITYTVIHTTDSVRDPFLPFPYILPFHPHLFPKTLSFFCIGPSAILRYQPGKPLPRSFQSQSQQMLSWSFILGMFYQYVSQYINNPVLFCLTRTVSALRGHIALQIETVFPWYLKILIRDQSLT